MASTEPADVRHRNATQVLLTIRDRVAQMKRDFMPDSADLTLAYTTKFEILPEFEKMLNKEKDNLWKELSTEEETQVDGVVEMIYEVRHAIEQASADFGFAEELGGQSMDVGLNWSLAWDALTELLSYLKQYGTEETKEHAECVDGWIVLDLLAQLKQSHGF